MYHWSPWYTALLHSSKFYPLLYCSSPCSMKSSQVDSNSARSHPMVKPLISLPLSPPWRLQQRHLGPPVVASQGQWRRAEEQMGSRPLKSHHLNLWTVKEQRRGHQVRNRAKGKMQACHLILVFVVQCEQHKNRLVKIYTLVWFPAVLIDFLSMKTHLVLGFYFRPVGGGQAQNHTNCHSLISCV